MSKVDAVIAAVIAAVFVLCNIYAGVKLEEMVCGDWWSYSLCAAEHDPLRAHPLCTPVMQALPAAVSSLLILAYYLFSGGEER
jgi:hypothetical protein